MDWDLMDSGELRAIANYFRAFHGADSFVTALERARLLTSDGQLATAAVWNQIAEEISHIETTAILQRCLERGDPPAAAAELVTADGWLPASGAIRKGA